ncbi:MAG: universal stress protein [Myxococcales bacterium]|nr:universal stress protein [Myxococcales bacterium]
MPQAARPTAFKTILVATDLSETGAHALDYALCLASERDDAALHVVYVAGTRGDLLEVTTPEGSAEMTAGAAAKYLADHVERARVDAMKEGEPIESGRVSVHVRSGVADDEIVTLAEKLAVSLIVLGTHGRRGLRNLVLGSVAESVLKVATRPVLVVRPKAYPPPEE